MKRAFIKYDSGRTLTSGTLVINEEVPSGAGWFEVPASLCCGLVGFPGGPSSPLKGYIKYSVSGEVVAGATIIRKKMPKDGIWREVPYKRCC